MEKEKTLTCYFHIVNSVKGGSGKSTFALLLADHFIRKKQPTYVIDLDVCGTSWETDFEDFFIKKEVPCYVNELMYQYCTNGFKQDIWNELKITDKTFNERSLKICLASAPKHNESFDKSEAELLENATYQIILASINDVLSSHPTEDVAIHIILDLPPSHEQTVEQICQHLLFDQSSRLKQYFFDKNKNIHKFADKNKDADKDNLEYIYKYKVQFYMLTPADQPSALEKNIDYIQNLLWKKRKYSSNILSFDESDELQFKICFVLNDNHHWLALQSDIESSKQLLLEVSIGNMGDMPQIIHPKSSNKIEYFTIKSLEYQPFEYKRSTYMGRYMGSSPKPTRLDLSGVNYSEIEEITESIIT